MDSSSPNPVQDVSKSNTTDVNKKKKIRLLILAVLVFLTSLVTNYVILKHRAEQQNQASLATKPQPKPQIQQSNVSLKTDYKNPFDKDTQYINPFSQYKNPFDSLK